MKIALSKALRFRDISKLFGKDFARDGIISFITTNSKEVEKDSLFFALDGHKTSGDNFISEAKEKGAFVVSKNSPYADLIVDDIEYALLTIAGYYKSLLKDLKHTIAITGSVGKTTTKNLLSAMLNTCYKTHSTFENYNNYLGVAHTVLSAPKKTEVLIIEAGMNHKNELSKISKAITPSISIITNVGSAHIGNFNSRGEIAEAKLEICEGMSDGITIVPFEEKLLSNAKSKITYSLIDNRANSYLTPLEVTVSGSTYNLKTDNFNLYNRLNHHLIKRIFYITPSEAHSIYHIIFTCEINLL